MLKRFLNPRWQHPDPDVRREAVATLCQDADAQAIAQVAREDELPALRCLALRRCLDLDLLLEQSDVDPDPQVREHARTRYQEVLAGLDPASPPVAERLERVARADNPTLVEFLAREGKETEIRQRVLAKVTREAVLRDVALKDPEPELRLEALERIQDENVLARVYQHSRRSDKRVSRRARERLEDMKASRERPRQVAAQCQQICASLEHLGRDGNWARDETLLAQLESRWRALEPTYRQEFEHRFDTARARFVELLAAAREADRPVRAAQESLIARCEALREAPTDEDPASAEDEASHRASLRQACAEWASVQQLSDAQQQQHLAQRFEAARKAAEASMEARRRRNEMSGLLARFERLAACKTAIAEGDVKDLERQREALRSRTDDTALSTLERRLAKVNKKLRDRLREQAAWKEETLATLSAKIDTLQAAVKDGRASEAVSMHDALQSQLEQLRAMGSSRERVAKFQSRLKAMTREVQVMRAWGRFGATRALEKLCEDMESLKGSEEHPQEVARKVHAARAAWKERSARGPRVDQALWKRFDAAASEAYLPCKAFFEDRAKQRKANLQRREQLLEELERFNASLTGGPDTDWKGAVRFRRELLGEWHRAHPVERRPGRPLAERFDARVADLDAVLGRERDRCIRHREQLIGEAETLVENPDKKAAAEACKELQRQWSTTVPASRGQENALWERFRSICDTVFAERRQLYDEQREGWRKTLEAREALCQRVEALLQPGASDAADAERELHRIQGEWTRCEPLPKREAQAVESRFSRAVRAVTKHLRSLQATARQADLQLMRDKASLCQEAQELFAAGGDVGARSESTDDLRRRWQALPTLQDDAAEAALVARFEQALETLSDDAHGGPDPSILAENLETRQSLCLRMEILAGIDSPPEYAQARLARQVERLANALKERSHDDRESAEELLRAWCVAGPAPPTHARALETRFQRAWVAHEDSKDAKDA